MRDKRSEKVDLLVIFTDRSLVAGEFNEEDIICVRECLNISQYLHVIIIDIRIK